MEQEKEKAADSPIGGFLKERKQWVGDMILAKLPDRTQAAL
jgi:hypothetical protein